MDTGGGFKLTVSPFYKLLCFNSDSTLYKCPVCYESTLLIEDGLLYCPSCGRRFNNGNNIDL